jgi:MEDS: MEthanogen/methylotroph, DcmR Sensory domain/STAS domain
VTPAAALFRGAGPAYREGVRAHGLIDEVPVSGPGDHLCWVYEDDTAFDEEAHAFLVGGLARGDRLLCVGERVIESLRAPGAFPSDLSDLVARGAVETLTLAEAYEVAGQFLPEQQLAYYDDATQRARAAGHRGLRVIAEVSALATEPAQRADLVRWEHIADAFAARDSGFSAMCAYRADLGRDALADVASVHPLVHAPDDTSSFRLFARGDGLVLAGSVDTFSSDRLARVLTGIVVPGEVVVLDLAELEFVDVAACRVIARWAAGLADRTVTVEVVGSSALLRRMWRVLGLDRVAPVRFAEVAA